MSQLVRVNSEVVAQRVGDEAVLVHTGTDRIYQLNRTATMFWELLSTGASLEEAQRQLFEAFEVGREALEQDVKSMVVLFEREGLLAPRAHAASG